MKGIVLAGGRGTRLHPLTLAVSKQLLPVYNKPMIYYPLSVLMQAGIQNILIIGNPEDIPLFRRLLGDGSQWGVQFSYAPQAWPGGLAEAFLIGAEFIGEDAVCLILGDNIFYGSGLGQFLQEACASPLGATLFGYEVQDPGRYGVVQCDAEGKILCIEEKPARPKSSIAVTGLYCYDNQVVEIARGLTPSARGELEITDLNQEYVRRGQASLHIMGKGYAWLDAGTYESLMQASQFVQVIETRQGCYIAALEESAYEQQFISRSQLKALGEQLGNSPYGLYLINLAERNPVCGERQSASGGGKVN